MKISKENILLLILKLTKIYLIIKRKIINLNLKLKYKP